jgi:hypothetical protein
VKIDDALVKDRRPGHPARLSQSELVCLAVAQALLGFHSEHRWIRFAVCHLRGCSVPAAPARLQQLPSGTTTRPAPGHPVADRLRPLKIHKESIVWGKERFT